MKIQIPCEWKTIDLEKEKDANMFGESLRHFCFKENGRKKGCYESFELINGFKKIISGKIYEEAKKIIEPEYKESLHVYYFELKNEDYYFKYKTPDGDDAIMRICESFNIVCAWEWNGDGHLYFRFNDRKVENRDCKKDYEWEWIKE